jgi:hypothetical protein
MSTFNLAKSKNTGNVYCLVDKTVYLYAIHDIGVMNKNQPLNMFDGGTRRMFEDLGYAITIEKGEEVT